MGTVLKTKDGHGAFTDWVKPPKNQPSGKRDIAAEMLSGQGVNHSAQRDLSEYMQFMPGFAQNPFSQIVSALVMAKLRRKAAAEDTGNREAYRQIAAQSERNKELDASKREAAELAKERRKEAHAVKMFTMQSSAAGASRDDEADAKFRHELAKDKRAMDNAKAMVALKAAVKSFADPKEAAQYAANPDESRRETYDSRGLLKKTYDEALGAILRTNKGPVIKSRLKK
jgi:hypothetical protein